MLAMLPAAVGLVDVDGALPGFLLVGGLVYALAGVHLERPLLWVGVLMLAAYVVLVLLVPPHLWTVAGVMIRSEEHTSELQSLMRISYAVFCLNKKKYNTYIVRLCIQNKSKYN